MSEWKRANTDWLRDARWGNFAHYLADQPSCTEPVEMTPEEWNRRVDSFDVDRYAATLASVGCRYSFLTIGQNSGYFCSPNATYDGLVGRKPSRLSQRDLVGELAAACTKQGVRLLVYLPSAAPCNDAEAIVRLRCTPSWDSGILGFPKGRYAAEDSVGTDERLSEFQQNWEAVIREWSLRWGKQVHGWWIDGCYAADKMYRHADGPNFRSFAEAMKAGNPDSLVAFNSGVRNPIVCVTEYEDYTGGEISNTLPTNGEEPCVLPVGRWVKGAQYHLLTFLGGCWCNPRPRFSDELVVAYTRYVNGWEGVVSWDHPVTPDGQIPEASLRQLAALGEAIQ